MSEFICVGKTFAGWGLISLIAMLVIWISFNDKVEVPSDISVTVALNNDRKTSDLHIYLMI